MNLTEATQEIERLRGELLKLESNYKHDRLELTKQIKAIRSQMRDEKLGKVLLMYREGNRWVKGEYWSFSVINVENLERRMKHEEDAYFILGSEAMKKISMDYYRQRHHVCGRSFVFTKEQREEIIKRFGFTKDFNNFPK